MTQDDWRDARVRHAEESLRAAVAKADEIIEAAIREAEQATPKQEPEPAESEPTYLRDAW